MSKNWMLLDVGGRCASLDGGRIEAFCSPDCEREVFTSLCERLLAAFRADVRLKLVPREVNAFSSHRDVKGTTLIVPGRKTSNSTYDRSTSRQCRSIVTTTTRNTNLIFLTSDHQATC